MLDKLNVSTQSFVSVLLLEQENLPHERKKLFSRFLFSPPSHEKMIRSPPPPSLLTSHFESQNNERVHLQEEKERINPENDDFRSLEPCTVAEPSIRCVLFLAAAIRPSIHSLLYSHSTHIAVHLFQTQ